MTGATLGAAAAHFVAATFVIAAATKLVDVRGFARSIGEMLGRPGSYQSLAVAVLTAEIAGAAAVAVPRWRMVGLGLLGTLLVAFTAVHWRAMQRGGPRARCRCFGAISSTVGPVHLVRNGVLLAAVAVAAVAHRSGYWGGERNEAVAALCGIVGAFFLITAEALFAPTPGTATHALRLQGETPSHDRH